MRGIAGRLAIEPDNVEMQMGGLPKAAVAGNRLA
jgi:hypothetical protein